LLNGTVVKNAAALIAKYCYKRAVEGASPYQFRRFAPCEDAFPVAVPEKICGLALSLIFSTAATP
jgi:hypothetical protein